MKKSEYTHVVVGMDYIQEWWRDFATEHNIVENEELETIDEHYRDARAAYFDGFCCALDDIVRQKGYKAPVDFLYGCEMGPWYTLHPRCIVRDDDILTEFDWHDGHEAGEKAVELLGFFESYGKKSEEVS
jgi:hypothetical protein